MVGTNIKVILVPAHILYISPEELPRYSELGVEDFPCIRKIIDSTASDPLLSEFRLHERILLIQSLPQSRDQVMHIIAVNPEILHFSGTAVANNRIQNKVFSDSFYLLEVLGTLSKKIDCIVLSSCYSKEIANMLLQFTRCVIGTSEGMAQELSAKFIGSFYKFLCLGKNLLEAYNLASASLDSEDRNKLERKCNENEDIKKIILYHEYEEFLSLSSMQLPDAIQIVTLLTRSKSNIYLYTKGDIENE